MDSYIKSGDTQSNTSYMYIKVNGTWIMIFDSQKSNDIIAPGITISAPTSTSSASPTYYGDGLIYRVYGTATDSDSGVSAVYVNDQVAIIDGNSWYYDITLTENEITTISIYAVDNAGNESPVYTRYVCYDGTQPTLDVAAPTGTSSSSPTYYQSDSATSYTVSGTVSDISGIQSVTVNGTEAEVLDGSWSVTLTDLDTNTTHIITVIATDNSGRTTTVNRYLRVEAYYQQAARIAEADIQISLDDTLTNSTVCASIAENSTAYSIMKEQYSSSMITGIDNTSYWNEGLNYLNYKCGLKSYLYHNGNQCTAVTGGWNNSEWSSSLAGASTGSSLNSNNAMYAIFSRSNVGAGIENGYADSITFSTKNSITFNGQTKVYWNYNQSGTTGVAQRLIYSNTTTLNTASYSGTRTDNLAASNGVQKYYWKEYHNNVGTQTVYIYNVYIA